MILFHVVFGFTSRNKHYWAEETGTAALTTMTTLLVCGQIACLCSFIAALITGMPHSQVYVGNMCLHVFRLCEPFPTVFTGMVADFLMDIFYMPLEVTFSVEFPPTDGTLEQADFLVDQVMPGQICLCRKGVAT